MARSTFRAPFNGDINHFENSIEQMISGYGFSSTEYGEERHVYKKAGLDDLGLTRFIKFEFFEDDPGSKNNAIIIHAWLRDPAVDKGRVDSPLVGGPVVNLGLKAIKKARKDPEMNLDGFVAALPKKMFKGTINKIIENIMSM